jgi:hypothetical protein
MVARSNRLIDPHIVLHKSVALAVALAGLGACDLVFDLTRPPMPTVCGAFGGEREVQFGGGMTNVRDFSFNAKATRGFVNATVETTMGERTGPVPLVFDNERWEYDPTFEANWSVLVEQRAYHARMARDNELWVGQVLTSPVSAYHVFHYGFVNNMWALVENTEVALTSNTDAFPGGELNEIVVGSSPPVTTDFLPIFRVDKTTFVRSVSIALRQPNASMWEAQELSGGVSSTDVLNDMHQPWSGALARTPEQRHVLIYAATPDGSEVGSDLFMSEKRNGRFVEGVPLTSFNTDDEELEPWVSEDCSMITFRRAPRGSALEGEPPARAGGTIYMSTLE